MWILFELLFQRQVFSALSQIAKHSVDLAEMVVEAEIFPAILTCLKGIVTIFCMMRPENLVHGDHESTNELRVDYKSS